LETFKKFKYYLNTQNSQILAKYLNTRQINLPASFTLYSNQVQGMQTVHTRALAVQCHHAVRDAE